MLNPRDIQNQRWIQNPTIVDDNPMTISLKRLSEKTALKWPVTSVTADSEVTECNDNCIDVKRSQSDIGESDSKRIQVRLTSS